jgi:hypothetical protein
MRSAFRLFAPALRPPAPALSLVAPALALLAPVLALLALALPSCASALVIGMGDQRAEMFHDPRFQALGIHYARLSIGWDALQSRSEAKALGVWLAAARADHVHPLISFEQSHIRGHRKRLPSPAQLGHQFRVLRARYPWVTEFATWNEANYCGQPTCHHPALVAAYYREMRHGCPQCQVLGAELLDESGMVVWVRAFQRALHGEASIWGLHNYIGANRLQTSSTRALLGATRGQVWFTETAGLVARHNHSGHDFPESATHAAVVTQFVFSRLARLSSRVKRVYLYQWQASVRRERWDSALIGARGTPRPAFGVFVRELHTLGQLPDTPAATALLSAAGRRSG